MALSKRGAIQPVRLAIHCTSLIALAVTVAGAVSSQGETPPKPPLGLPAVVWPVDNPYSKAKWELGRTLYFEKRISSDGTIACSYCHDPADAFSKPLPVAIGIKGQKETRNAPTDVNRAYSAILANPATPAILAGGLPVGSAPQFWDGRAPALEEQAKGPMSNPVEMTNDVHADVALQNVVARLKAVPGYRRLFQQVFGTQDFTIDQVTKALSTFERTIYSGNSPYDRYIAGDKTAMTPTQISGYQIFKGKKCDQCHLGFNFTDNNFSNIGIGMNKPMPDFGRFLITGRNSDRGSFKTPTMREVEHTAPYGHDGSLATLEDVVKHYNQGGIPNPWLDQRIVPLKLTPQQQSDLIDFMKALSGEGWQEFKPPAKFPQ